VPSHSDAVVIALAHASFDGRKTSDWLVDIVANVDAGVDWMLLESMIDRHGLHAPAAVAFRYLDERLQRPVPSAMLHMLDAAVLRRPLATLAVLSESRPNAKGISLYRLARALTRQRRGLRIQRRSGVRRPVVLASVLLGRHRSADGPAMLEQTLPLPDRMQHSAWSGGIDVTIAVELPPVTRRIDFEINSNIRHHLRVRALVYSRRRRRRSLRFKFAVSLLPDENDLVLVAVASRLLTTSAVQDQIDRYGAIPFRIIRLRIVDSKTG
jgi:hypothetical protein